MQENIAAYRGNSGVVRLCLRSMELMSTVAPVKLLKKNQTKASSLELAARKGRTEVVKALVDNQADVNASSHIDS